MQHRFRFVQMDGNEHRGAKTSLDRFAAEEFGENKDHTKVRWAETKEDEQELPTVTLMYGID